MVSQDRRQGPVDKKRDDWLRFLRNRMIEFSWRLALCRSDPEKFAHMQQRYDEHALVCQREMPEWFAWFKEGGEFPEA